MRCAQVGIMGFAMPCEGMCHTQKAGHQMQSLLQIAMQAGEQSHSDAFNARTLV